MRVVFQKTGRLVLVSALAISASASLSAQQDATEPNIVVNGTPIPDPATMPKGPEIKGIISARNDDRIKITTADGNSTVIAISEATKIKTSSGLFGGKSKLGTAALLNGLPVTVKTLQWSEGLLASHISFRKGDFKTANMIYNGTDQRFGEQAAATEALRGRMGDIDKYNIKGTTNVYFDTGKWALSAQAKDELCAAAAQADSTSNALLLVVGYTDSVGSEDYNQMLSERRANSVINHLQQKCRWAPYRMLTPTGMAESDPVADNSTEEGKAQNRRVAVNILVSKSVDGI
ncbi:OmpA family protein [Sphingorhabdus pulchriflava]|uniref:OmpA family protein n=1 Tax=Sphingorhabdus pulchriflava TaxID=2292257 RepID=A0A371BJA0_9SPHN|nr:OmpA family protein [Sphingorhabdus pulchriflava]MBK7161335.1 OmpA family protein [Sphingomonadales bacterium]RDV07664.1 OmpA family protein [Sphingorhabdus pulchriflava]